MMIPIPSGARVWLAAGHTMFVLVAVSSINTSRAGEVWEAWPCQRSRLMARV